MIIESNLEATHIKVLHTKKLNLGAINSLGIDRYNNEKKSLTSPKSTNPYRWAFGSHRSLCYPLMWSMHCCIHFRFGCELVVCHNLYCNWHWFVRVIWHRRHPRSVCYQPHRPLLSSHCQWNFWNFPFWNGRCERFHLLNCCICFRSSNFVIDACYRMQQRKICYSIRWMWPLICNK